MVSRAILRAAQHMTVQLLLYPIVRERLLAKLLSEWPSGLRCQLNQGPRCYGPCFQKIWQKMQKMQKIPNQYKV